MNNNNKQITLELLLKSFENDFDNQERENILNQLRYSTPSDDSLLGAKLILEQNDWDYLILKNIVIKAQNNIENIINKKEKQKKSVNYLKYAAVLIPFMVIAGYYYNTTINNSIESFYIKETGLPCLMSAKKTNWDALMQLYRSEQFEKAIVLSEKIKVQKPVNDTINYFQAIIAYDLKKYDIARNGFKKVTQDKESVFYNEAEFRLGFVLKHLNQDREANRQFEKVKENRTNPYQEDAIKVLKALDFHN